MRLEQKRSILALDGQHAVRLSMLVLDAAQVSNHLGGLQVVVNYNTSAAPAEEVAEQIKSSGGDALVIGADVSKPEGVDK